MVFAGISAYLYKLCSPMIGPTNTTFFYYLSGSLIAALVWLGARERVPFRKKDLIWPFLTALMLFVSIWAFNFSLQQINVSLASLIRSMSFFITAILAVTLSGERLTFKDYVALTLLTAAILVFQLRRRYCGRRTAHFDTSRRNEISLTGEIFASFHI
jgi:drug/metabolite transporter (DMT)-like permease